MGALVPEALAAADRLAEIGTPADVVCVTSPGLLFRALRARQGVHGQGIGGEPWILEQALPATRATPLVTVRRASAHAVVPGHRQRGAARRAGRDPVRPVRGDRG